MYDSSTLHSTSQSAQANKVLRNTYMLLGLTMAFSASIATVTALMNWPSPNIILLLVGFYGLMWLTEKNRNKTSGLFYCFALTGFMGYTAGAIVNKYIGAGHGDAVVTALAGTGLTFFATSAYALTTKRDLSKLTGFLLAGGVVLMVAVIANLFLQMTALSLAISCAFILFSSLVIMWQTQMIINGGEDNYISATVTLFVSIYNIFLSLLQLVGLAGDD
ncbi:Bax inhibitor-1/YccA family protein [Neptuniibacter sp. QD37_11]|uniref:Bax inhibitor-1/YccA family protein n=1 Tax=Neptuniibacter sp. QD37_11 TaxID=3398209 RepID=UPI0039F54442